MRKSKRTPLTRDRVLKTALDVADREGLDAVSMRRLGEELRVEAMSLYNHVRGKDDILDGITELVLREIDVPTPGGDWRLGMKRRAASARQVLSKHPWAIGLLEARTQNSSPRRLGYYDAVLGSLREAGFDAQLAMRGFTVLDAYIYGFIIQELSLPFRDDSGLKAVGEDLVRQMAEQYPYLTEVTKAVMTAGYDRAVEFEFGLDLILDALEHARR